MARGSITSKATSQAFGDKGGKKKRTLCVGLPPPSPGGVFSLLQLEKAKKRTLHGEMGKKTKKKRVRKPKKNPTKK